MPVELVRPFQDEELALDLDPGRAHRMVKPPAAGTPPRPVEQRRAPGRDHRHRGRRAEAGPQGGAGQRAGGAAQLLARVGGHDREAQAGRPLRHGRRPHRLGEHALLEGALGDARRLRAVADHERDDVGARARHVEPLPRQLLAQRVGVVAQALDPARLRLQHSSAASAAAAAAGGRAVDEATGRAALTR